MRRGNWRGRRHQAAHGYFAVIVQPDDPLAVMAFRNKRGTLYALEHRIVMARYLNRPLERWETVHHINGDRSDNRLENLQLRVGRHGSGQALRCADCGSTNLIPVEIAKREEVV